MFSCHFCVFLCRYSPDGLLSLSICDARSSLRQCHAHDQLHHGNAIFFQQLGTNTSEWMKNRRFFFEFAQEHVDSNISMIISLLVTLSSAEHIAEI